MTKAKKTVAVFAAFLAAAAVITVGVLYMTGGIRFAKPAESKDGAYLFVHFVGNAPEQERIHFAAGKDGYHFTELNNSEPVIIQKKGKQCVRDPYILRGEDGCFYIIGTDMKSDEGWTSNHALATWKSEDLVTWTDETIIDIRNFGGEFKNTNRAWAPQAIYDSEKGQYMVYWANSTEEDDVAAMYFAYTSDFKTMTRPELLYRREGIQTIDGDIVYNEKNGKYYMYFKHDEDQTIAYVTADKPNGPYSKEVVVVSLAPSGVEGSTMYNIAGTDTWVMIMDEYGKNRFFMQQTTDFENFTKVKRSDFTLGENPRHGSVLKITDSEYETLMNAYGK